MSKEYSKRIHEIFAEFGYTGNNDEIENAIKVLINEIVLEAVLEERNGLLQNILDELKDVKKDIINRNRNRNSRLKKIKKSNKLQE